MIPLQGKTADGLISPKNVLSHPWDETMMSGLPIHRCTCLCWTINNLRGDPRVRPASGRNNLF